MAGTTTSSRKGKKLGPRVSVTFKAAQAKGGAKYTYMLKSIAEKFGIKPVVAAAVKNKQGKLIAVRGCVGAGSIKIKDPNSPADKPKFVSIPVPGGATIADIRAFIQREFKGKKPDSFTTVDGRSYPFVAKK